MVHRICLQIGHHEPPSSSTGRPKACKMSPQKVKSRSILLRDYVLSSSVSKVTKPKGTGKQPSLKRKDGMLRTEILARSELMAM